MQEFIYYNASGLDFPVSEKIFVTTNIEDTKNKNFLISNSKDINSELSALEIDFYIKNSQDDLSKKIKNVLELYEIAAIKYDFSQDIPQTIEISNSLLIISSTNEEYEGFVSNLQNGDFELFKVDELVLKSIEGTIGNFAVTVMSNDKEVVLNVSQIVWFNEKQNKKRTGIYDGSLIETDDLIQTLKNNINSFSYKKFTTYNPNICQYHERKLGETCSACAEVCPTMAITKDETTKSLVFSNVDCNSCGECVSICPSGSLDSAATSRDSLFELSQFYKNRHPFVISSNIDVENLMIPLKEDVFPLIIDGDILDEATLLTLLQVSGSQIVYFSENISKGTSDAIRILNEIYEKKYQKKAILLVENEIELSGTLNQISFIEDSYFNFNQTELKKREIFSQRLQKIVGNDNLGIVKTGENIHYGRVLVNEANCTLCLSCVGACNVDALFANEADFTLRINPSLCTACGYCEVSCPEADCLTITKDEIELQPSWFKENILAKDKLFACVECGKEFATTKAIEKIASIMAPIFAKSSETKKRTLYCCEDCKAKLMIKEGLLDA